MNNGTLSCAVCGFALQPQFRFCPSCGSPTQPAAPTPPAPEPSEPAQPAVWTTIEPDWTAPPVVEASEEVAAPAPEPAELMPHEPEPEYLWPVTQVLAESEVADEVQAESSAPPSADAPFVDFASLFGYGSTEEQQSAPMLPEPEAQIETPEVHIPDIPAAEAQDDQPDAVAADSSQTSEQAEIATTSELEPREQPPTSATEPLLTSSDLHADAGVTEELPQAPTMQTVQFAGEDMPADSVDESGESREAVAVPEFGSATTPISLLDATPTDSVAAAVSDEGDTDAGAVHDEGDLDKGAVHDEGDTDAGPVSDEGLATDDLAAAGASMLASAPVTTQISTDQVASLSTTPITVEHLDAAPVTSRITEAEVEPEPEYSYTPPAPESSEPVPFDWAYIPAASAAKDEAKPAIEGYSTPTPEPAVEETAIEPVPEPLYVPSYVPVSPAEDVQPQEPAPDVTEDEPVPQDAAPAREEPAPTFTSPEPVYVPAFDPTPGPATDITQPAQPEPAYDASPLQVEPQPVYTQPEALYVPKLYTPTPTPSPEPVVESAPPPPPPPPATEPVQYYVPVYTPTPPPTPEPEPQPQPQQEAQPEVLSFDELFSWTATEDNTSASSQPYTPPVEAQQDQAAPPQGGYYTPTPSWEQPSTPYVPAPPPPDPEPVKEPEPTVFTFDASTRQTDTAAQQSTNVPSWNPDDDIASTPAPGSTQSGGWSPTPTPPPTESVVYQSYSQSSGSTGPQPIQQTPAVQSSFPPPGQRPKPGTPEYEEMARKALEGRLGGTPPSTAQANTSPLGAPPVSSTPAYGYRPDTQPYTTSTTPQSIQPVQPSFPPPGQRPKPGTPEYEEMARQAMQARGVSASSSNTSPLGAVPQQSTPSYTPDPTPAPPPPVQPSGPRPKPGTPEYEEMARKAMEERARQQGK